MTVRWKPLLVLSGLFLVIAVIGVVAITYTLMPRGSADILPLARADRDAKQYDKALIYYRQALQKDSKNPAIYEELATMYGEWAAQAPAEKKAQLQYDRIEALINAAKYGKKLKEPRRLLLADAMYRDVASDSMLWAKEVVALEPTNADAHYVLAAEALEEFAPKISEIKKHLAALQSKKASPVRIAWIKAQLAQRTEDTAGVEEALSQARPLNLPVGADPVDRMALLRLRALDVQTTKDPVLLAGRVQALQSEGRALLSGPPLAPARITRLSLLLEKVQKSLIVLAANSEPKSRAALNSLVDAIEGDVETLFQKALDDANKPEMQVFLTYADHLRFRQKPEKCLAVVDRALKSKLASRASSAEAVLGLRAVAVEAALSDVKDPQRFTKVETHIKKLIESPSSRYQGLGHLFRGAIDLELSGVGSAASAKNTKQAVLTPTQLKLRASALNHLKVAATQLPDAAEAQARYGVALVLAMEQGLGRQYLQNALRLGNLDPQYQIWAAWSMVQAGYPEEAQPIVDQLLVQVAQGRQPRELEGTLHLLSGEIHQARRSPDDLKRALSEYERSIGAGQKATPAVQLRLAQIDVQLGHADEALKRIETLRTQGQGGPAAEHLAVLVLRQQGKAAEARACLDAARKRFPDSDELVGVDASLLANDGKPKDADRVLADYLKSNSDNIPLILMRAQIQSDMLDNPKEARRLLIAVADRSENSGPLVQLARLELSQHDYAAVAATIAKIRGRWKEAAIADLLDAQVSLDQNDLSGAVAHFDAALKKDPTNKLVQFWKAQLDSRNGSTEDARESFEQIARARPTKEVDSGLSLMTAAESALASIALENGDVDGAIARLEDIRKSGPDSVGGLARGDRWQLVRAYAAKDQWAAAKREIASLLNDPKNPPSDDERVRGANYYRVHDEVDAALAQLDYVIKNDPAQPPAVVTRAYILATVKKYDEANALLRKAISVSKTKPPAVFYLMLAAVNTVAPPADSASQRALASLDEGIKAQPESTELVFAKFKVLRSLKGEKEAVAFVESKAAGETNPKGLFRRMLVQIYRDQNDFTGAERVLRELLTSNPKDSQVAANLVRILALEAIQASDRGKPDLERSLNDKAAGMLREFRTQFPNDLAFLQAECDLAARRGDLTRALAVTQEMDKISKNAVAGPLARARIYSIQGRLRESVEAYTDALERNPRQLDVRIQLGQAELKLNEATEALRQAKLVLDVDPDQRDALLLQARATAAQPGRIDAHRDEAINLLSTTIRKKPKFAEAYRLKAEIQVQQGARDGAIATLKDEMTAVPDDAAGLAQLIQIMSENREGNRKPTDAEIEASKAVASKAGENDTRGNMMLAIAVGYHKAGQFALALPWAEKAASKLDAPLVHLNYGDLLLSLAESLDDAARAKSFFAKAVSQYDMVLKVQSNSVEAVNNKAWILHTYLGQSSQALELAQGLSNRVDAATLPGEFFDTLGAIQEATGRTRDAEDSYAKGLRKSPDHPVLNYHMGKLFYKDRRRAGKAGVYLEKALAGRSRLTPTMVADLNSMIAKKSPAAN